jgi:hypothetical protein
VAASAPDYFYEQELGPLPLVREDLPPAAWTGISATFHRFADQHYFAAEFPEQCPDGKGISGTSMAGLRSLLVLHIPKLGDWPREQDQPDTITAMDVVVFGWYHAQEPRVDSHHSYFGHDHYTFDQGAGRVPVHPSPRRADEDRPGRPVTDIQVESSRRSWGERDRGVISTRHTPQTPDSLVTDHCGAQTVTSVLPTNSPDQQNLSKRHAFRRPR